MTTAIDRNYRGELNRAVLIAIEQHRRGRGVAYAEPRVLIHHGDELIAARPIKIADDIWQVHGNSTARLDSPHWFRGLLCFRLI